MSGPADPPDLREERKVVTVVFADLVGSTALAERLDPEEVRLVVGEAMARMVSIVDDLGGTVKDLAGDGVLALFGAPVAHEDDAERAVRAGMRIAAEVGAYAAEVERSWGVGGFDVRVGVETGPVVLGPVGAGSRVEYAAFGDTVNTAARIQSEAEPGGVLVGAGTRRLVEPLFTWSEPRALTVKGKARPVRASAVTGVGAPHPRLRGLGGVTVSIVGRGRELETAGQLVEAVLAGAGGALFVTGEAGIGKTRLVAEIRERVER